MFYNVVLFLNNLLEFCQNKVVYIVDLRVIKNNTYSNLPIEISDCLIITDSFCSFYIKFLNNLVRFLPISYFERDNSKCFDDIQKCK